MQNLYRTHPVPRDTSHRTASLDEALEHCARLLHQAPALALEQANEILKHVPQLDEARFYRARAFHLMGEPQNALPDYQSLTRTHKTWVDLYYGLGLCLADLHRPTEAIEALRTAAALSPDSPEVWQDLSDQYLLLGQHEAADQALAEQLRASVQDPDLMEAAYALCDQRLAEAEYKLKAHLKRKPEDIAALRMLAEVAARLGRFFDSEQILTHVLELAPHYEMARHNLAVVLYRQNKGQEVLDQLDLLLRLNPTNASYRSLRAAALTRVGEFSTAIALYETLLKEHPHQPKGWMSYGHCLKTVGRSQESIEAYKAALTQAPTLGEVWWSLANLKTYPFGPHDISAMEDALQVEKLDPEDQLHLHFALGKAYEDQAQYDLSFSHYECGNSIRRSQIEHSSDRIKDQLARMKSLISSSGFKARLDQGHQADDPIFIIGLPRSGSTLIEQILSSHPLIEGTMELPDILAMARRLERETRAYPECLGHMSESELKALGQAYLDQTRSVRQLGRPLFIDKMPNNFLHVGLILTILPRAKIIDARRSPMGTCFAAFKQHFARGQTFSYDQAELGTYYRGYVDLMDHVDQVLPGRVLKVRYEDLVSDTETEIRRLLDYCGVPFDPACIQFHQNDRAVRTASSEQVRRPIYSDSVEHWRHFEPWLGPLKQALGPLSALTKAP